MDSCVWGIQNLIEEKNSRLERHRVKRYIKFKCNRRATDVVERISHGNSNVLNDGSSVFAICCVNIRPWESYVHIRYCICSLLRKFELLSRYVTMDKTWIHHFTPESKWSANNNRSNSSEDIEITKIKWKVLYWKGKDDQQWLHNVTGAIKGRRFLEILSAVNFTVILGQILNRFKN